MGNVNETPCETGSTTTNKAIKVFESKKEDDRKKHLVSRPKKRNRDSEPIIKTPAKLLQSEVSVANVSESRPPSRLRIRDVDNSEMWISTISPKLEALTRMNANISTTSSNTSFPISESGLPETFDVSVEMSFVNRSEISDFFVAPSLTDLGVVDQVSFAEIPSLTTAMAQIELEQFTPEASSNGPSLILPTCSDISSVLDSQRMNINLQSSQPTVASAILPLPEIVVQDEYISSCRNENAYMAISSSTSGMTGTNVDVTSTTSIFTSPALPSSPNITKYRMPDSANSKANDAITSEANNVSRDPTFNVSALSETPDNILDAKISEDIPLVATYADATNLAVRFPEIASQVLSRPLLSLPSKGLDEPTQNLAHRTDVSKIPHTAASPNWAAAPLEPEDALDTGSLNSKPRRRQSGRNGGPSQDERSRRHNGRNRSSTSRARPSIPAGLTHADQVEKKGTQRNTSPERRGPGFVNTPPRLDAAAHPFVLRSSSDRQECRHHIEVSQSLSDCQREPRRMSRETQSTSATCQVPTKAERTPMTHDLKIRKATIAGARDSPEDIVKKCTSQATVPPALQAKEPARVTRQTRLAKALHQEVGGQAWMAITDPPISKPAAGESSRPPAEGEGKQNLQTMSREAQSAMAPDQVQYTLREAQFSSVSTSGPGKSERAVTFGSTVVIPVAAEVNRSAVKPAQVSNAVTNITQGTSSNGFQNPPMQESLQAAAPPGHNDQSKLPPGRSRSRSPASGPPEKRARRSHSKNQEASHKPTNPKTRPERQKVRKQQVAGISAATRRHLEGSVERKATSKPSSRRHSLNDEVDTGHMNRDDGTKQKQTQNQNDTPGAECSGPVAVVVSEKPLKSVEPEDSSVTARAPGSGDSPFRDIHLRAGNASPIPHRSPGTTKDASVDQCDISANSIQRSPCTGSPLAARDNDANFQAVEALRNASFELGLTSANDWLPPRPTQSIPEGALSSIIEPTIPTMPYATPFSTLFKPRIKPRSVSLQVPKSPISWRRTEPSTVPTPFGLDPNDNSTPSWLTPPNFFTPDPTSGKYIVKGRLSAESLEKYPGLPPARSRKSLPSQASMDVGSTGSQGGGGTPFKFGRVENDPQNAIHELIRTIPSVSRSVSMKIQKSRT